LNDNINMFPYQGTMLKSSTEDIASMKVCCMFRNLVQ